jgi:putative transposase
MASRRFSISSATDTGKSIRPRSPIDKQKGVQGSQFTSADFIKVLKDAGIAISMDGRGAWRDNVFVERLWRTVKHEEVYLRAYGGVSEARASIGRYLGFYNGTRPHSSLGGRTPDQAYLNQPTPIPAAA